MRLTERNQSGRLNGNDTYEGQIMTNLKSGIVAGFAATVVLSCWMVCKGE